MLAELIGDHEVVNTKSAGVVRWTAQAEPWPELVCPPPQMSTVPDSFVFLKLSGPKIYLPDIRLSLDILGSTRQLSKVPENIDNETVLILFWLQKLMSWKPFKIVTLFAYYSCSKSYEDNSKKPKYFKLLPSFSSSPPFRNFSFLYVL